MKTIFILLFFSAIFAYKMQAQVTIGSNIEPHEDALLDLKEDGETTKGLLLPRVKLSSGAEDPAPLSTFNETEGMIVYNIDHAGTSGDVDEVKPGIYYSDGEKWIPLKPKNEWFYLPSFPINVAKGGTKSLKLYPIFVNQFGSIPLKMNSSAADDKSLIVGTPGATDYEYMVVGCDESVFDIVEIDTDGTLHYNIIADATEKTYINIVMRLKEND